MMFWTVLQPQSKGRSAAESVATRPASAGTVQVEPAALGEPFFCTLEISENSNLENFAVTDRKKIVFGQAHTI